MDKITLVIIVFIIFSIINNVTWIIMLLRTNDDWMSNLVDLSMKWCNNYKELKQHNTNEKIDEVDHDNTIISKDACKSHDAKLVPLKWRSGENEEKLGIANLEIHDGGLYITFDEETYKNIFRRKNNNEQ
jgi:hypothetical protein